MSQFIILYTVLYRRNMFYLTIAIFIILAIVFLIEHIFFNNKFFRSDKRKLINVLLFKIFYILLMIIPISIICSYYFYGNYLKENLNNTMLSEVQNVKSIRDETITGDRREYYINFCHNYVIHKYGVMLLYDENFNQLNKITIRDNIIKDATNDMSEIIKYEKEKVHYAKINGRYLLFNYTKVDEFYVIAVDTFMELDEEEDLAFLYIICPSIFSIFLFLIFICLFLEKYVTKNLNDINKNLNEVGKGNLSVRIRETNSIEFETLKNHLNDTIDSIKEYIEKIKLNRTEELKLANVIQSSQLPHIPKEFPFVEMFANSIPAETVGGDFYDFYHINNENIIVLIADISGKGIPAAMFLMKAKSIIKNLLETGVTFENIVPLFNNELYIGNGASMFATLFILKLNLVKGTVDYVNAGHCPILVGKVNNINHNILYKYLDDAPDKFIGYFENEKYNTHKLKLEVGDSLFLYTDGLTEAKNQNGELFGKERLKNLFNEEIKENANLDDIEENIKNTIINYRGGAIQNDDLTYFYLRYVGNENILNVLSTKEGMSIALDFLNKYLFVISTDNYVKNQMKTVFDEIFSNFIRYAYKDKNENYGNIKITFSYSDKIFTMVFEDTSRAFDPLSYVHNDNVSKTSDRINGGMGIMFVKNIMDECHYEYKEGKNIFNVRKKL